MADQTPQLQESQPVLKRVGSVNRKVASGAEGYEAFAKVLGSFADVAEQKTEEIVSEQSQTMYINSVANVEQVKTSARQMMLEHPDKAPKIAKDTDITLDSIKQSAYVNNKDRSRLNAYIGGASNEIALHATQTEVHQRQLEAAFTHYSNWGDQLKAYQSALLTDHDKSEHLKESMIASLHGLVATGAISPHEAASNIKMMSDLSDVAQAYQTRLLDPHTTALDYHTVNAHPLNDDKNNPNAPINEATQWSINYHSSDRTFQGIKADISNRMLPDFQAFASMSPHQREEAIMMIHGTQVADGLINSGEQFPIIEKIHKDLSAPNKILNYRDQATRNALGSYIDELKSGNYLNVISKTPSGNAIMQDFVSRDSAIRNSNLNGDQKNKMLLQNKNKLVNESVAYAQGHNIPSQYVQPVPQADVATIQNGFKLGNSPEAVLQTIGQYSKQNQGYLAQAMKNPEQNMVVQGVAFAGNDIKPQDKLDFITANQDGASTYLNKMIEDHTKENELMTRIASNLSPQMRILQQNYDNQHFKTMQDAMLTSTLKYAKFLAQKDNNIGATDKVFIGDPSWKKYVDQASKIYSTSFAPQSGTNWMVNKAQLPVPMSDAELDVLADHVTEEGYRFLKQDRGNAEYQSAIDRNPLRMIVTPTGDCQAIDSNGSVYYSMPFTSNTIPFAQESKKRRQEDLRRALNKSNEEAVKQRLHVRLPEDVHP